MKKLDETETFKPETSVEIPMPTVDESIWASLGQTAMIQIDISLGNRSSLDQSLDLWNAMYELRIEDRENNVPWEGAPNVTSTLIPAEVEELTSRISGSAILPRPYAVHGNDPNSQGYAHQVEQFYNGEYARNKWEEPHHTAIHLAARDGTAIIETLWDLSVTTRLVEAEEPDEQGNMTKVKRRIEMVKYDAPRLEVVELRDFVLIPSHAKSISFADAVCRKKYMGEQELLKLVKAGICDADQVETALSFSSTGRGNLSFDRQGTSTYQINDLINVVDVGTAPPQDIKMNRGPIEIWVVYTNQYDLDGDGVPEENVLWVSDRARILLGYCPFPYWQGRPFHKLCLFPRPNRFYGFSVPERLRNTVDEINAQKNARLAMLDWCQNPTILKKPGMRLRQEDNQVGPGSMLDGVEGDIAFIRPPEPAQSSYVEQQMLEQEASRITGAPQTPGQPSAGGESQGRSARAAQSQAAINGAQTNMVIARTRRWMLEIFEYMHGLYNQYGKNQMETVDSDMMGSKRVQMPKEVLGLDYTLGIAGAGGPLDKETRRGELMMLASYLKQSPLVAGNLERVWAIDAQVVQTFDLSEITKFIGTQEEARQQAEAQAQAAAQQQQQELMITAMQHSKVESKAPAKPQAPKGPPSNS